MSINFFEQLTLKGIEYRQSSTCNDEYRICCLFCKDKGFGLDTRFRLGFNIASGLGHCFNCSWSSRKAVIEILRAIGSDQWTEVKVTDFTQQTRKRPEPVNFPEGFVKLKDIADDDMVFGVARRYCRKRGVTPKQLAIHEIGATVLDFQLSHRIVFPVRYGRMLAGMVGRDWTGQSTLRYLNTSGNKVAYNVHPEKYPMGKKIIVITEGVLKALAVERATGYEMVCSATLGNSASAIPLNQFKEFEEVVIFPDPNIVGMRGFQGMAERLQPHVKTVSMVWPWPEADADELEAKEIMELIEGRRVVTPLLGLQIEMEMRDR